MGELKRPHFYICLKTKKFFRKGERLLLQKKKKSFSNWKTSLNWVIIRFDLEPKQHSQGVISRP